jgi:tetratricopeptide (TPR) repeat protein
MLDTESPSPTPVETRRNNSLWAVAGILLLVFFAYANHFQNSFHFDDSHSIQDNPWIRDLRNIPRFFTDGNTFSTLPTNRSYRPVVSTSLAVDYWLGHGLQPLWFHITTFFWYLVQLAAMFPLFRATYDSSRPSSRNRTVALFAVALYGVHPAMAETVNYIIQRADIFATLGVVAGFALYILFPSARRYGLYLLPVVAGILSKAPAAVFPVLLFAWIWWFDGDDIKAAAIRSIPSFIVSGVASVVVILMNPPTYINGATAPALYRLTQPWVLLGYFRKFFIPTGFTADTDETVVFSLFDARVLFGFGFLIVLAVAVWWCAKRRELRPVAFGIFWFLVTSVPTSLIALAEVENDHRMYFSFVGLAMAACWGGALLAEKYLVPERIVVPACALLLVGCALGTRDRNVVWSTDENLWRDVSIKSPRNGRGLMNYGLTLMAKGDYPGALDLFNRSLVLNPNYYFLEINLGIAYGAMNNPAEAERHFTRAVALAPDQGNPHFYYGRWLSGVRRTQEALAQMELAARLNPDYIQSRYMLMQLYAETGNAQALGAEARSVLARFPGDATAASWLARSTNLPPAQAQPVAVPTSAEGFLTLSLTLFQSGRFAECVDAANHAIKINPVYAEAWNNLGACYNAISEWDKGIAAEQQAIRLKPDFQLAKNNLAWGQDQKRKGAK